MDYLEIGSDSMNSNLEPLKNNKKDEQKISLKRVQEIALLGQAITILAIIVSFIMSRYVVELTILVNIYLVILSFVMSYTSYSIYKRKGISILYIVFGLIILLSILLGI
mgnify:CR=1 FL=1